MMLSYLRVNNFFFSEPLNYFMEIVLLTTLFSCLARNVQIEADTNLRLNKTIETHLNPDMV